MSLDIDVTANHATWSGAAGGKTNICATLHDHQRTNFGLLLVGGDGCWEVLSREPMLRSRVHRRVAFRPMTGQEVLEVLPRWHRLYRDQDPELLGFNDDVFGHGQFRNWVHFTKSFQQIFPQARLDEDKARACIGTVP